jgi:hypothetical protein
LKHGAQAATAMVLVRVIDVTDTKVLAVDIIILLLYHRRQDFYIKFVQVACFLAVVVNVLHVTGVQVMLMDLT